MTPQEAIEQAIAALQVAYDRGSELMGRVVYSCGDDSREADTLQVINQIMANVLYDLRSVALPQRPVDTAAPRNNITENTSQ